MSGAVEHGTQYQMTLAYEHKLQRTAYNFTFGPFGQVKGKYPQWFVFTVLHMVCTCYLFTGFYREKSLSEI
jgi:hypothetical protein